MLAMRRRWWPILSATLGLAMVIGQLLVIQTGGMSYVRLRDELRAQGASVQEDGQASQALLNGADYSLTVDSVGLDVFEYRTMAGARLDSARISPGGHSISMGIGSWGASLYFNDPPHWFYSGRIIVLIAGSNAGVLALLRSDLGPQIAGRKYHRAT